MNITYLGHSSFRIKSGSTIIVTDPYSFSTGLHFPKQEAAIVTISHKHEDHSYKEGIKNEDCFFVEGPGEYEIKDIMITGIKTFHDNSNGSENGENVIYIFESEGIKVCHLGDLGHVLDVSKIKELENIDVLFVPVGGVFTIDAAKAREVVKKIDPSFVIPMHYKVEGMSEVFKDLASVDEFVNEITIEPKRMEKLNVTDLSIPEEMELVILERKK